jgi:hypothetical protein
LTVVDYLPKLRLKVSRYLLIIINPSFIFLTTVQLHRAPDTETMIEHVEGVLILSDIFTPKLTDQCSRTPD